MTQLQTYETFDLQIPGDIGDLSGYSNIDSSNLVLSQPRNILSMAGKLFTFKNADGTNEAAPTPLEVIILNVSKYETKTYFEAGYDATDGIVPVCSSSNGKAPDSWIQNPQANNCDTCPKNQDKSGKEGRGKACKTGIWIAVLPNVKTEPLTPYALRLPLTSMIAFKQSVTQLTKSLRLQGKLNDPKAIAPLEFFITKLSFRERDKEGRPLSFPVIEFSFDRIVPKEKWEMIRQLGASDEVKKLIRMDDDTIAQQRLPQDKAVAQVASQPANPAPVATQADDDIPFNGGPAAISVPTPAPVQNATPVEEAKPAKKAAPKAKPTKEETEDISSLIDSHLNESLEDEFAI